MVTNNLPRLDMGTNFHITFSSCGWGGLLIGIGSIHLNRTHNKKSVNAAS